MPSFQQLLIRDGLCCCAAVLNNRGKSLHWCWWKAITVCCFFLQCPSKGIFEVDVILNDDKSQIEVDGSQLLLSYLKRCFCHPFRNVYIVFFCSLPLLFFTFYGRLTSYVVNPPFSLNNKNRKQQKQVLFFEGSSFSADARNESTIPNNHFFRVISSKQPLFESVY